MSVSSTKTGIKFRIEQFFRFSIRLIRHNPIACLLFVPIVLIETISIATGFASDELIIARVGLFFLFALAIVFPRSQHYTVFRILVTISVPLAISLLVIGMYWKPITVDQFAYEDGPIENLSAIVLFISTLVWLGYLAVAIRKRLWLHAVTAMLAAVVMFVVGMEEISWMQRIVNTESSEFFLVNNSQGETNFHNLNTALSEVVMTAGTLTVLVIMPFYRKKIAAFLAKIKLSQLTPFLPSAWILLPFATMAGLIGIGNVVRPAILFVTLFTLAILIYQISAYIRKRNIGAAGVYIIVALIGLFTAYTLITFNYDTHGVRSWAYSEYLEFFIAYGLLIYTIDFIFRNAHPLALDS